MHLKATRNPFAAYAELPRGVRFKDQERGEEVVLLLRQHPIVTLRWTVMWLAAVIFPLLLYGLPWSDLPGLEWIGQLPESVRSVVLMVWYAGAFGFFIEAFFIWYYSVYLTTNRRVVDSDFSGLLQFTSTEASLTKIENVTHDQKGVWQLLFNYGDVTIKTAAAGVGGSGTLTFDRVPKPAQVADLLTDLLPTSRNKDPYRKVVTQDSQDSAVVVDHNDPLADQPSADSSDDPSIEIIPFEQAPPIDPPSKSTKPSSKKSTTTSTSTYRVAKGDRRKKYK